MISFIHILLFVFLGRPTPMSAMQELKLKDREERNKIVLWKMPFTTMRYFFLECFIKLVRLFQQYVNVIIKCMYLLLCLDLREQHFFKECRIFLTILHQLSQGSRVSVFPFSGNCKLHRVRRIIID